MAKDFVEVAMVYFAANMSEILGDIETADQVWDGTNAVIDSQFNSAS